ncbi:hypothetical protein SDC9_112376 [bioreactor metagenome]|uniref:Uncharacterized protein n=1 Tax=bioreactor metagenome TaxID=1076179 RepID=A0A645BJ36_9ZZZZ
MGRTGGRAPHGIQQQHVPPPVVQPLAAISGGVYSRAAVQRVHTKAGVICDGGQSRQSTDGPCLQHSILREGLSGLLHIHGETQVGGTDHLHAQNPQNGGHFLQLTGIMGRQYKFHRFHIEPPNAAF